MSTTVTYKGDTLTTVSNNTKVLGTSGTWMEGDLTLTDSTTRIVITTISVTTSPNRNISFSVDGEPTYLMFVLNGGNLANPIMFTNGIVSGAFDGEEYYLNRAVLYSTTVDGSTTTNISVRTGEGTYDYTNGTVTLTTTSRFPIGTYTVVYAYEP